MLNHAFLVFDVVLELFEKVLGKARTDEIKNGGTPTAVEFVRAKACF